MKIRPFEMADEAAVIALWRGCQMVHPANDPARDIARKLKVRPDLFLVGELEGQVVATVMAGYEGHRGWINYLAVDPKLRRRGLGVAMLAEAERRLALEGCPKINLQVRRSNLEVVEFYKAAGYAMDDVVSLGKRLCVDTQS